ncbi:hypothetical protein GF340_05615, partial [Candidatus Peregrinibacteria bacterium]|nr:hypothetical protein [Candidatus Peregrinibacteria bacterium]
MKFLMDLFFPVLCMGCNRLGESFCDDCLNTLKTGRLNAEIRPCEYIDALYYFERFSEKSLLMHLLHCFKYEFVKDLGPKLGLLMKDILPKRAYTIVP